MWLSYQLLILFLFSKSVLQEDAWVNCDTPSALGSVSCDLGGLPFLQAHAVWDKSKRTLEVGIYKANVQRWALGVSLLAHGTLGVVAS